MCDNNATCPPRHPFSPGATYIAAVRLPLQSSLM